MNYGAKIVQAESNKKVYFYCRSAAYLRFSEQRYYINLTTACQQLFKFYV